jgi:hypothetical protein
VGLVTYYSTSQIKSNIKKQSLKIDIKPKREGVFSTMPKPVLANNSDFVLMENRERHCRLLKFVFGH